MCHWFFIIVKLYLFNDRASSPKRSKTNMNTLQHFLFSFNVYKMLMVSFTFAFVSFRRIRVNDAGSDSIKEDFRAKIRRTPARNERSVAQYGGAKSITNDSPSSSSSGMR